MENIYFLYCLSRHVLDSLLPFVIFQCLSYTTGINQDTSVPRQFGTSPKWPWDSSAPKKIWCRSVLTPSEIRLTKYRCKYGILNSMFAVTTYSPFIYAAAMMRGVIDAVSTGVPRPNLTQWTGRSVTVVLCFRPPTLICRVARCNARFSKICHYANVSVGLFTQFLYNC